MIDNLEFTKDITLALAYLTSWNDSRKGGSELLRTWTGYDFDILRKLNEEDLIFGNKPGNKSFYFTEKGEKKAKELVEKISKCLERGE